MKICPLCKTKFEDDAEFCPTCKAQLDDLELVNKAESGPVPKSFWIALICVFAFIGGMVLIYRLVYKNIFGL